MKHFSFVTLFLPIALIVSILAGINYYLQNPFKIDDSISVGTEQIIIDYKAGQLFKPQTYKIKTGSTIIIKVTANITDSVELMGYEYKQAVVPKKNAVISFVADQTGKFNLILEESKVILGTLDII